MASKHVDFDPSERPRARQPTGFHTPAPIVTFKGSIVHREATTPEIPTGNSGIADIAGYLREGWSDIGIWKSAVCVQRSLCRHGAY